MSGRNGTASVPRSTRFKQDTCPAICGWLLCNFCTFCADYQIISKLYYISFILLYLMAEWNVSFSTVCIAIVCLFNVHDKRRMSAWYWIGGQDVEVAMAYFNLFPSFFFVFFLFLFACVFVAFWTHLCAAVCGF